jgi:hypothetical protein
VSEADAAAAVLLLLLLLLLLLHERVRGLSQEHDLLLRLSWKMIQLMIQLMMPMLVMTQPCALAAHVLVAGYDQLHCPAKILHHGQPCQEDLGYCH